MILAATALIAPPSVKGAVDQGCSIKLIAHDQDLMPGWYVRVYVKFDDKHEWDGLYSIRQPEDGKKALIDCADWMKAIRKVEIEALKQERKEKKRAPASEQY